MPRVISKVVLQPALSVTLKVIKFDTRIQVQSTLFGSFLYHSESACNSLESIPDGRFRTGWCRKAENWELTQTSYFSEPSSKSRQSLLTSRGFPKQVTSVTPSTCNDSSDSVKLICRPESYLHLAWQFTESGSLWALLSDPIRASFTKFVGFSDRMRIYSVRKDGWMKES